jgi:hypothetical protein
MCTFWLESLKGRDHWENSRHRGEDNIMDPRKIGFGSVDWIHLAHERDRWRTLVNTLMSR